jgi:hypothetical protein
VGTSRKENRKPQPKSNNTLTQNILLTIEHESQVTQNAGKSVSTHFLGREKVSFPFAMIDAHWNASLAGAAEAKTNVSRFCDHYFAEELTELEKLSHEQQVREILQVPNTIQRRNAGSLSISTVESIFNLSNKLCVSQRAILYNICRRHWQHRGIVDRV